MRAAAAVLDAVAGRQSQFIDASKWNAAQVFERQRSYLRRFKDKDKGAGTQWQLGSDPDYQ